MNKPIKAAKQAAETLNINKATAKVNDMNEMRKSKWTRFIDEVKRFENWIEERRVWILIVVFILIIVLL